MNIVSKKSTLLGFVLAGLVIGSMPMTAQAAWGWADFNAKQKMLISIGLVSCMLVGCKKAVDNPEQVTWDDAKKLVQIQDIFTQDYWINVYHLINDGYIGQIGKGKAVLGVASEETGEVKFQTTKEQPSTGICGKTLATAKLVAKKADDLVKTLALPVAVCMWYCGEKIGFTFGTDGIKASVNTAPVGTK